MTLIGGIRRFDLKYNFEVFISGLTDASFSTCSEPVATTAEAQLWQGGSLIPIKEPARMTFNDITLERGMSRDILLWDWYRSFNSASNAGGAAGRGAALLGFGIAFAYKRGAFIAQNDRAGVAVENNHLFNAWPKEVSLGDFSNDADEFRIERVVLGYDWFDRVPLTTV